MLKKGDMGVAVEVVQQALEDLGMEPGPVDGIYGPRTAAAVRRFNMLTADDQVWDQPADDYLMWAASLVPARERTPVGREELVVRAGDRIIRDIGARPGWLEPDLVWERRHMREYSFPIIGTLYVNTQMLYPLEYALELVDGEGLGEYIEIVECYASRRKMTKRGRAPSTHAWGMAIDINPNENRVGTYGTMPGRVVACFLAAGFVCGRGFRTPDPMHFQFVRGY